MYLMKMNFNYVVCLCSIVFLFYSCGDAAKKVENITKNLKDKKIMKNIFVKNKIINFITK